MYIIQTNRTMIDFQSYMYEVKEKTWEEFKEYILNEDS
jgi:patatin-like phospholipase/acyl hydrolase